MTSLTGIAGRLLLVSLTVVLIVPVAAIAFAELGDDPSDGESVANATPSPAATATTGALEPEDMLGPDITDGGAGGRPAPSRGTIHELPKTPPAQLPDASSALPRTEALDELRTVIGLAEAVDAIRASDSGGVLVQMQTETWTCAERSHWGYPSVDACMQAPSTTADGQFDVVYWEGLRFAAGQMDQLLQLLFASKPTPVLGFKVTGTSE